MAKKLIMVVDDEKELADLIAETIQQNKKYEVITAYSAKEALKALDTNRRPASLMESRIQCIILDIKMPEMDGLQFLERIRGDYEKNIGVIILSAYGDEEKWGKASAGMVAGYLRKPVNKDTLLSCIEGYFAHPEYYVQQANLMLLNKIHKSESKNNKPGKNKK